MDKITYKKNPESVLERLKLLYARKAGDRIFATFKMPSKTMDEFRANNKNEYTTYPDPLERAYFWDRLLKEKALVEDDSIPSAYLSEFDQGLYGALIGGNIQFLSDPKNGWISSMVKPMYKELAEFQPKPIDKQHPWFQKYVRQLEIFSEVADNKFGISHFILIDSLNFIFELVGATKTYLSLFECPDKVWEVIEFAFYLNVEVQKTFFEHTPLFQGGTFSNMVQWIPGRIISESVDPFHMTSVDDFEQWGREYVEKMYAAFDGGVLHIHSNGRHLLNAASTLKGLKAIYLLDEKDNPLAFDVLPELQAQTGDVPLVVGVDGHAFENHLKKNTLPGGVLYVVHTDENVHHVNRLMEKVRDYRN